ncbi:MAG TPA: GNAT family N-acetyltransferase, partial [Longimicrobium sp.]|nr:GNAT family N-acetyltransferase [Longimicrobium sp.]
WEDPSLWLSRLVTHPAYRRRRAALAILEAACMAALAAGKEAVSLNVRADNTGGCGAELRGGRCTDAICPSIRGCG